MTKTNNKNITMTITMTMKHTVFLNANAKPFIPKAAKQLMMIALLFCVLNIIGTTEKAAADAAAEKAAADAAAEKAAADAAKKSKKAAPKKSRKTNKIWTIQELFDIGNFLRFDDIERRTIVSIKYNVSQKAIDMIHQRLYKPKWFKNDNLPLKYIKVRDMLAIE